MRTLLFFILLCVAQGSFAQEDIWAQAKSDYPQEPAVYVERSQVLNLIVDGDSLKAEAEIFEDVLHLKEQTDAMASKKIYGSGFSHVGGLKAKTLVWEKNKYRGIDVKNFKKNSEPDGGIFFDDSYYYSFDFPAVASRNRTQVYYKQWYSDPKFIPGYIFASYMPAMKASLTIRTTRDVELEYRIYNDPEKLIRFNKTEKGKTVTYEWMVEKMPAFKVEDKSPSIRNYVPHIVCYVKSYNGKSGKVAVLNDLNDLFASYVEYIKGLNTESSEELRNIVSEIKSKSGAELDLVKNVFYWVQEHIQYIAFEEGMRGFIPHHGSYVCEKRYGDCKDMANLIVNMLTLAGVKSYHTWIGTRDLPYRYSELPTPMVDNHMIAVYISPSGEYYYLDATSDYTPFGYPSSMIQGKEAFIAKSEKEYEIREVPVLSQQSNIMTDSMKIALRDGAIAGTGSSKLIGYPKVFSGYELDRADAETVKKYVTRLIGKGSNKFFLDAYDVADMKDRDKPTSISYTFRISDYHQKIGDELYVNLHLNKDYYNTFINPATRKTPFELDYKYSKTEYIDFEMPEGYAVEYVPQNLTHKGKFLGFDVKYEVKDGRIAVSKTMYVDYLILPATDFEAWNESVKVISEAYKESIILKKK